MFNKKIKMTKPQLGKPIGQLIEGKMYIKIYEPFKKSKYHEKVIEKDSMSEARNELKKIIKLKHKKDVEPQERDIYLINSREHELGFQLKFIFFHDRNLVVSDYLMLKPEESK